jgi:hypothetical protein
MAARIGVDIFPQLFEAEEDTKESSGNPSQPYPPAFFQR